MLKFAKLNDYARVYVDNEFIGTGDNNASNVNNLSILIPPIAGEGVL